MAKKDGSDGLQLPMVFVKHGDPLPGEWMARHPGWVKFPATLVQRGGGPVRANRVDGSGLPSTDPAVLAAGMARPASAGAPVSPGRFGRRPGSRPPAHPQGARELARSATWGGEDPVDAYLRVKAAMDQVVAQAATGPDAGAAAQSRLGDARERVFLRLLRWLENGDVSDDVAYHARFGGHDPMSDADMQHYVPKSEPFLQKHRKPGFSTAAGAYQVTADTWSNASAHLKLTDFGPESQDRIAVWQLGQKDALLDVRHGALDQAFEKLKKIWSSLPGGSYSHHSDAEVKQKYKEFLQEEDSK